jgi:hypothetical protein
MEQRSSCRPTAGGASGTVGYAGQLEVAVSAISVRRAVATLSAMTALMGGAADVANGGLTSAAPNATNPASRVVPVLGSRNFWPGRDDRGFGTSHPKRFFNGGDPSGLVTHIRWTHWGAPRAHGWGKNAIFKPGGGYYAHPVRIELHAFDLGRCTPGGRRAYVRLKFREPRRPGGPLGKWHFWSGYQGHRIC